MTSHDRRPRFRNTYHITHTHCTITCIPRDHSLLTERTLFTHTLTQVPRFSELNPRPSDWIFIETDDSSSCICHQSTIHGHTSPWPCSSLTHTHRFLGSHNSTPDILSEFSVRLTTLPSCICYQSRMHTHPLPMTTFLVHTHTQVQRDTYFGLRQVYFQQNKKRRRPR